jgi:hypothetical protein
MIEIYCYYFFRLKDREKNIMESIDGAIWAAGMRSEGVALWCHSFGAIGAITYISTTHTHHTHIPTNIHTHQWPGFPQWHQNYVMEVFPEVRTKKLLTFLFY